MNNHSTEPYTLITGSSQGIGKQFALICAKQQQNLVLVALPEPQLTETANEIRAKYDVTVHTVGIDLIQPSSVNYLYNWCQEHGIVVDILINNVGIGSRGAFDTVNYEEYLSMVQLNINVMMGLTRTYLPAMKKLPQAYILNMGSLASVFDLPYKAVYSGTKRFVYTFSRALQEELIATNVHVTVVCPGPVNTIGTFKNRTAHHSSLDDFIYLDPAYVADYALRKMKAHKKVVYPGTFTKLNFLLKLFLPQFLQLKLMAYLFKKEQN